MPVIVTRSSNEADADARVAVGVEHHGVKLETTRHAREALVLPVIVTGTRFATYLHDDRLLTLDDTVEFFNLILGVKLDPAEKKDFVAFLRTLYRRDRQVNIRGAPVRRETASGFARPEDRGECGGRP